MRLLAWLLCLPLAVGCTSKALLRPPPDDRSQLVRLIEESDLVAVAEIVEAERALGFATASCRMRLLDTGLGQADTTELEVTFRPGRNDRPIEAGGRWMVFLRKPASDGGAWRAAGDSVGIRIREEVLQTGEPVARVLDLARQDAKQRARFENDLKVANAAFRVTARWDDGDGGLVELGFDDTLRLTGTHQSRHRTSPRNRFASLTPEVMSRLAEALSKNFAHRQRSDPASPRDRDIYVVVTTATGAQRMKRLPQPDLADVPELGRLLHDAALNMDLPPPGLAR